MSPAPNHRQAFQRHEVYAGLMHLIFGGGAHDRGSELLREVAWVVFDEVHYMQDRERGVVWEETIIFLPRAVRMVFLSATLSNASEFAAWVAQVWGWGYGLCTC